MLANLSLSLPLSNPYPTATRQNLAAQEPQDSKTLNVKKTQALAASVNKSKDEAALKAYELIEINALKKRDAEVKAHEQAHLNTAGNYAIGGMHFSFERGPDGVRYAVAGEVRIDTAEISGDPEATLQKATIIKRAALAPANPSSQDRKVAVQATSMMFSAQAELLKMQQSQNDPTASHSSLGKFVDAFA